MATKEELLEAYNEWVRTGINLAKVLVAELDPYEIVDKLEKEST